MIAREPVPLPPIAEDVATGLFRSPKSLAPKLLYDKAGSELFERITELAEYYLTRTETALLQSSAGEIASAAGPVRSLVELGAATSRKTTILIRSFAQSSQPLAFFPVDISVAPLRAGQIAIRNEFPDVQHAAIVADLSDDLAFLRRLPAPRLVLYLGSSIGNFDSMPATAFLARLRQALAPGDSLLLGTDMKKSPELLIPAYDDAEGVTAAFSKNVLARINRELGGNFDPGRFRHVVRWNEEQSRIEIYLESTMRQSVNIGLLRRRVNFDRGELIHIENSYKYTHVMVDSMLHNARFTRAQTWTDAKGWFAEHLALVAR